MKLITYLDNGRQRAGAVVDDAIFDLSDHYDSMLALIEDGELDDVRRKVKKSAPVAEIGEVKLEAPIPDPRRNLFCVGWNYLPHFDEGRGRRQDQEQDLPEYPTFFTKATTTVAGPENDIPFDAAFSEKIDYEAELAVVIGRQGRSIPVEEAMDYVFGYMAANDVTARDVQRRHGGQWFKGKSMDHSCPMGPWIIVAEEVSDPQNLAMQCHVNGVEKQSSSTKHMYFSVAELISELSLGMTLLPGDILLTGTPEGVGQWREPPEFLSPGDEVTVAVSGIGKLTNKVSAHSLTPQESHHVT
jgi:2-keto-4-pentenoate hydratase/2-oxohepta-3-ene-1,7-dioic acid hydratase in catechol pathway